MIDEGPGIPKSPSGNIDYDRLQRSDIFSADQIDAWGHKCEQFMMGRFTIGCDFHRPAVAALACDHCLIQDPVHPDGIIYMKDTFFVCTKCFFLIERRKFHIEKELRMFCRDCLEKEVRRLQVVDPALYKYLGK